MVSRSLAAHVVLLGVLGWPGVLGAQDAAAPHPCDVRAGATARVCRAGYDAVAMLVPVGAAAVTGGNRSLGSAAGGQGFGDIGLTLRAGFVRAILPSTAYDGVADTVPAARRLAVIVPRLDMRFGLLNKELPVGTASVDFLASVSGIPKSAADAVRFGADVRSLGGVALGFGYGVRLGMAPAGNMPVVSLNAGRQDLPRFTVGDLGQGSNVVYSVGVSAIDVRLLPGKRFGLFELTGRRGGPDQGQLLAGLPRSDDRPPGTAGRLDGLDHADRHHYQWLPPPRSGPAVGRGRVPGRQGRQAADGFRSGRHEIGQVLRRFRDRV